MKHKEELYEQLTEEGVTLSPITKRLRIHYHQGKLIITELIGEGRAGVRQEGRKMIYFKRHQEGVNNG